MTEKISSSLWLAESRPIKFKKLLILNLHYSENWRMCTCIQNFLGHILINYCRKAQAINSFKLHSPKGWCNFERICKHHLYYKSTAHGKGYSHTPLCMHCNLSRHCIPLRLSLQDCVPLTVGSCFSMHQRHMHVWSLESTKEV